MKRRRLVFSFQTKLLTFSLCAVLSHFFTISSDFFELQELQLFCFLLSTFLFSFNLWLLFFITIFSSLLTKEWLKSEAHSNCCWMLLSRENLITRKRVKVEIFFSFTFNSFFQEKKSWRRSISARSNVRVSKCVSDCQCPLSFSLVQLPA